MADDGDGDGVREKIARISASSVGEFFAPTDDGGVALALGDAYRAGAFDGLRSLQIRADGSVIFAVHDRLAALKALAALEREATRPATLDEAEAALAGPTPRRRGGRTAKRGLDACIEAARASRGNISLAARRLGIARGSFGRLMERWPELREVVAEERERLVDLAERTLVDLALVDRDYRALRLVLATWGADRGWDRQTHGTPGPTQIEVVIGPPPRA